MLQNFFIFFLLLHHTRITESPFKVHIEQVVGLKPKQSAESLALYHKPLEIGLKHSTINMEHSCPFIQPAKGVDALHGYAEWIVEVNKDIGGGDGMQFYKCCFINLKGVVSPKMKILSPRRYFEDCESEVTFSQV